MRLPLCVTAWGLEAYPPPASRGRPPPPPPRPGRQTAIRQRPLPEQSEFFWQASSPLEHDAWHVPPPCPENPTQHFIPLAQLGEPLQEAPDPPPPPPPPLPPAGDIGHDVEVNW
jgi:hypothetical protein